MTTDKPPPASDKPKTTAKRRLKAGKRTARTSGMSQSAFAGYATTPPATPPAKPHTHRANPNETDDQEEAPTAPTKGGPKT